MSEWAPIRQSLDDISKKIRVIYISNLLLWFLLILLTASVVLYL